MQTRSGVASMAVGARNGASARGVPGRRGHEIRHQAPRIIGKWAAIRGEARRQQRHRARTLGQTSVDRPQGTAWTTKVPSSVLPS